MGAVLSPSSSHADLGSRNLLMGSSAPSVVTTHTISFNTVTTANIGSISLAYCTTALGSCTVPTGLATTAAILSAQSGATGFTLNNSTNGLFILSRTASSISGGASLQYAFSTITNPSTVNTPFYIRIATYTGTDGATGQVDGGGTVVGVVVNQITITGTMPESLIFCVGTSGTDCTNLSGTAVNLGIFSPVATNTGSSLMAASTNASSGYQITVSGTTLASGSNTIAAMGVQSTGGAAAISATASGQFGMNLTSNSSPSVGAVESGPGNATVKTDFGTVNNFRFFSGDSVASSTGPTQSNTYTVSYIVNVAGDQAAGVYTTTLTYICTGFF
jgi:hypothetical protein